MELDFAATCVAGLLSPELVQVSPGSTNENLGRVTGACDRLLTQAGRRSTTGVKALKATRYQDDWCKYNY